MYIGMGSKSTQSLGGAPVHDTTSWNNAAGFVNGILRFKLTDSGSFFSRLTPYVGVGAGVEYLTSHTDLQVGGVNAGGVSDEDVVFAAQGLVGLGLRPEPALDVVYRIQVYRRSRRGIRITRGWRDLPVFPQPDSAEHRDAGRKIQFLVSVCLPAKPRTGCRPGLCFWERSRRRFRQA